MATSLKLSGADKEHGYEFGEDGLWSALEVREYLAGISQSTLDRLVESGKIRKGNISKKRCYCVRSVRDYVASIES